jgi:FkbM family methyltransferase
MSTLEDNLTEISFAGIALRFHAPDDADHIQRTLRRDHCLYEEDLLLDCFARKLPRGVIIDVGANIGVHTIFFAKVLRRRVIAIEPYPKSFELLARNVALNELTTRVTLLPVAAGRRHERGTVEDPPAENWGQSRVRLERNGSVEIMRLDELDIRRRVAAIKVDVEGMEEEVLAGARKLIRRHKPIIYVEAQDPRRFAIIDRRMRRLGYQVLRRFNHTPTYLFAPCSSRRERLDAILEKSNALVSIGDLRVTQQEIVRLVQRQEQSLESCLKTQLASLVSQLGDLVVAPLHESLLALKQQVSAVDLANRQALDGIAESIAKWREGDAERRLEAVRAAEQLRERLAEEVRATVESSVERSIHGKTYARSATSRSSQQGSKSTADPTATSKLRGDCLVTSDEIVLPLRIGRANMAIRLPRQGAAVERDGGNAPRLSNGVTRIIKRQAREQRVCNNGAGGDLISVIMTAYNGADFIAESVRNVLAQTHRELELIVVDDASHDDTFSILTELSRGDSRVRPIKMFDNRGTYWCKNYGLTFSRGEFVTFQDSDDRSDSTRLQVQFDELRATGAVMATCNYVRVDSTGAVLSNRGQVERKAIMAAMLNRQEVLRRVGYFDSVRTSADDEFIRRVGIAFGQERICHVDRALYFATVREGSLTNNHRSGSLLNMGDGSPRDQSFLSAPRREYVRQYARWHDRIRAGRSRAVVPYPQRQRPFPAPAALLPTPRPANNYVTASMASIPVREPMLQQTVASILPQVDVLNVYLNGYPQTPAWLNRKKIHVVHSRDFGDLRDNGKFFFLDALLHGYHFTIDDDIVYPKDYVQKCVMKIEQYRRQAIVGVHGVILADPFVRFMQGRTVKHFKQSAETDSFVNLLGTGASAYHTDTMELSLDDFPQPGMADVWLAIAARRQKAPMISLARPTKWLIPLAEAEDDSLFTAAMRDDLVQTLAIKKEGSWNLRNFCAQLPLCQSLAAEFSRDELSSQGVDIEVLPFERAEPCSFIQEHKLLKESAVIGAQTGH